MIWDTWATTELDGTVRKRRSFDFELLSSIDCISVLSDDIHTNREQRARRSRILIRRILVLIATYLILGAPHSSFILLETLSIRRAPPYAHRLGFMFMSIGVSCITLAMIYFTRQEQKRRQLTKSRQLNHALKKRQHPRKDLLHN